MRKISTALATVGIASTALVGLASSPASAQPACAAYPQGTRYSIDISPLSKTVPAGSLTTFTGHAHRGQTNCGGQVVVMQYAKPGQSFRSYRTRVTNSNGVASIAMGVPDAFDTFRWVWYPTPNTPVTSAQVRLTRG